MPLWLSALLGYFIVARATRFITADYLAADFRAWIMRKFGDGKLYYLITCAWCTSIWVALPVAAIVSWNEPILAFFGLWAGYSYVHGIVTTNLDD